MHEPLSRELADWRVAPQARPVQRWRVYLLLANAAMQRALFYRARALITALTGLIQVSALFFLWRAFYAEQAVVEGYRWADIRTYLFLTFLLGLLVAFNTETQISAGIRDGSIVVELVKPLDFLWARFAEACGAAVVEGVLIGSGAVVVGVLLFQVQLPAVGALLPFVVSVLAAFVLKFLLAFLTGMCCFWTTSVIGLIRLRVVLVSFFSGALVPLAFLPQWVQQLAAFLPFQGTLHTPVSIYLGHLQGSAAWWALALQGVWIVVLWLLSRWMLRLGLRRLTSHGG
jgi:ABC-2 type transport system permease protein